MDAANVVQTSSSSCALCTKPFLILAAEKEFYKKKDLPFPIKCSKCRRARRLSLKNPREFHKRECDKCKKEIITTYPKDTQYIVYCQECFVEHVG